MRAARVSSRFTEQGDEQGGDVEAESSDETDRGEGTHGAAARWRF